MRVLTEDDLVSAQAHFASVGLPTAWVEIPHQGRTLHTTDPVGTPLELCATMARKPRLIMNFDLQHGACPQRLDHFQVLTPDVRPACEFYMGVGFRLSEYIVADGTDDLRMVFLQRKGNPHDIVFGRGPGPRLSPRGLRSRGPSSAVHLRPVRPQRLRRRRRARSRPPFRPRLSRYVCAIPTATASSCSTTTIRRSTWRMSRSAGRPPTSNRHGAWGPGAPASWLNEASAFAGA